MNVLVRKISDSCRTVIPIVRRIRLFPLAGRLRNLTCARSTLIDFGVSYVDLCQHLLLPRIPIVLAPLSLVCTLLFLYLDVCDLAQRASAPSAGSTLPRILVFNSPFHERLILVVSICYIRT